MKIRLPDYKWRIFFVVGLVGISTSISMSSINMAMPIMSEEFGVSIAAVSRLALVYSVISCSTLLLFGKTADMFGYRGQFAGGFLLFGLASLAIPLFARGLGGIVFFRSVQAVGGAMMISITQALCNRTFPANERGKALGISAMFVSVGLSIGPSLGGLLLSYFTWRSIFYINVPFCFLGIVTTLSVLKKEKLAPASLRHMDWLGAILFALFIGLLTVAFNFSADWGFASGRFLAFIAVSLCSLILFIYRESRIDEPFMKLTLFRSRTFSCANTASFCSYVLQQTSNLLIPFYLIQVLLLPSRDAGLVLLTKPISMMLMSPIGGRLADRFGSARPAITGLCMMAIGCLMMGAMTEVTPIGIVILGLVLYGVGNSISVSPINSAIFSAVPREESGIASGMVGTMRHLGQAIGVAYAGSMIAMRQSYYMTQAAGAPSTAPSETGIYLLAQRDTYYFSLIVVAIAVACMIAARKRVAESQ